MNSELTLLAHRGGMDRAPENTLTAFRQAYADGADVFECDVCLTNDKEPVMIHADIKTGSIEEATGCEVPLDRLTLAEVEQLKMANSDQPVAHLDQVLDFVRESGFYCWLEPKILSLEMIEIVAERIERFNLVDKVGVLTFFSRRQLLTYTKRLNPEIKTSAILINPMGDFLKQARSIAANNIVFGWDGPNQFQIYNAIFHSFRRKVRQLKANDIAVEGGHVRTVNDAEWLLRHEVNGLWADDVPLIRSYAQASLNRTRA